MSIIKFKVFERDQEGNITPRIKTYTPALHWIFTCLNSIAMMPDPETPSELIITSINDSVHMKNSRHYLDEAVDLRSKSFPTRNAKLHFVERLSSLLNCHQDDPSKFTVLFENEGAPEEHFHVQVKKGQSFMRF